MRTVGIGLVFCWSGKELCRVVLAKMMSFQPTRMPLLALHDPADPPIVYASPSLRIEDRGDKFADTVSLPSVPAKGTLGCRGRPGASDDGRMGRTWRR